STDQSYIGTNGDPIQVTVDWANRSCAMSGALVGSVEDRSGTATVNLTGTIVNQPPTANAGRDQTVECTSSAGASTVIDASGSTDPDGDIVLFVWRSGTRAGAEIGTDPVIAVSGGVGASQTYFLKVVDSFGEASESSTVVKVVDTTPPVI